MDERVERIGEVKYHMNRLTEEELNNIRFHSIARVSQALHEVQLVESELALRRPEEQLALADAGFTATGDYIERTPLAQRDFESHRVDL